MTNIRSAEQGHVLGDVGRWEQQTSGNPFEFCVVKQSDLNKENKTVWRLYIFRALGPQSSLK